MTVTVVPLTEADANWLNNQDPDTGRALAAALFGGTPTRTRIWSNQHRGWWWAPAIQIVTAPCGDLRPEQGSGHPTRGG